MMLQALAIERAAPTQTAERVLHYHIAHYHNRCDPVFAIRATSFGIKASAEGWRECPALALFPLGNKSRR
jgi:hypothetical protein